MAEFDERKLEETVLAMIASLPEAVRVNVQKAICDSIEEDEAVEDLDELVEEEPTGAAEEEKPKKKHYRLTEEQKLHLNNFIEWGRPEAKKEYTVTKNEMALLRAKGFLCSGAPINKYIGQRFGRETALKRRMRKAAAGGETA